MCIRDRVYISHKMDEIKVIADEVTIMRDGQYSCKWDVASMTKEEIIAKMVGRELSNLFPPLENVPSDEVMMKVEDFTSIHPRSFRHCSFELKKGEILGVAGLVGAQRTELMEGIFGLRAHTSGKVWIKGEEVNIKQPRDEMCIRDSCKRSSGAVPPHRPPSAAGCRTRLPERSAPGWARPLS